MALRMMSEENGSAEQQAARMDERAAEARATGEPYRGEGYGMKGWEGEIGAVRRFARRVRSRPAGSVIAGLALIAASAAAIAIRSDAARPVRRSLRRRSRVLAEAFRERDAVVKPRAIAVLARLAAIGLAGLTWRRVRALGRDRYW
jgi:hypothetical protein